jgi:hypothetical protein
MRTCELQVPRPCALVPSPAPQQNPCLLDKRLKITFVRPDLPEVVSVARDSECPDRLLQSFRALSNSDSGTRMNLVATLPINVESCGWEKAAFHQQGTG